MKHTQTKEDRIPGFRCVWGPLAVSALLTALQSYGVMDLRTHPLTAMRRRILKNAFNKAPTITKFLIL